MNLLKLREVTMKYSSNIRNSALSILLAVFAALMLTACFSLDSQASEGKEYISIYLSSGEEVIIYAGGNYLDGKYVNDIGYIEGVSYNQATNTLTLNNFVDVNASLGASYVGEDFKIEIVGECHFMYINVYQGCLELCGNGVLVLNEVLNQGTVTITSSYEHTGLIVSDGLTLLLYEDSAWFNGAGSTGFIISVPSGVAPVEINGMLCSQINVSASWFESNYRHDYDYDYNTGVGTAETYYSESILKGYHLVSSEAYNCVNGFVTSNGRDISYVFSSENNIIYIMSA